MKCYIWLQHRKQEIKINKLCRFSLLSCSRDNTLEYDYGENSEHFFNLAAFRFKENYDDVFIHCKLTVCRKGDDQSRCAKGCQPSKRRRRSTTEGLEEELSAELYVGPVKLKQSTNEEGECCVFCLFLAPSWWGQVL